MKFTTISKIPNISQMLIIPFLSMHYTLSIITCYREFCFHLQLQVMLSSCYNHAIRQSYSYSLDLWPIRYILHIWRWEQYTSKQIEQAAGQTSYKYTALKVVSYYFVLTVPFLLHLSVITVFVSISVTHKINSASSSQT